MKNKILTEIASFCETCPSSNYCSEDECPLYRIERIIDSKNKVFKVRVEETLSQIVTVKASSEQEALDLVEQKYKDEKIVLDDTNYVGYDINIVESD